MDWELEKRIRKQADEMSEDQWVAWMTYFAPRMLDDQEVLVDLLCRRAEREAAQRNEGRPPTVAADTASDRLPAILQSVGLRIAVADGE